MLTHVHSLPLPFFVVVPMQIISLPKGEIRSDRILQSTVCNLLGMFCYFNINDSAVVLCVSQNLIFANSLQTGKGEGHKGSHSTLSLLLNNRNTR